MVMDPLSGHQAIGKATRPLVVGPPLGNQAIGMATKLWLKPLGLTQQDLSTNIGLQQHVG